MPIPKLDFRGEVATITMMELRQSPGEIIDRVSRGLTVHVTKNGKPLAVIRSPDAAPADDTIIVHRDGSTADGRKPLTFGLDLGGEYASH